MEPMVSKWLRNLNCIEPKMEAFIILNITLNKEPYARQNPGVSSVRVISFVAFD